ncbi:MAG: DUF2169 domain-containing protein [Polyangiaceae bacterium]
MKIVKPTKLPILHRVVEIARKPQFHVAAMLGFPLASPRALMNELAFWQGAAGALGENGAVDDGFAKARAELLVCGSFFAPGGRPVTASFVRVRLGGIDKRVAVVGDREWQKDVPTAPEPFVTMPISWNKAFGGAGFARNPYGKGASPIEGSGRRVHPLPNIERYGEMMRSPGEQPEPAGLGPRDVTFAQRRARTGTIDKRYLEEWYPGMPGDMDPTFFNVAPEDQWLPSSLQPSGASSFFRGDEEFLVENMHPELSRIEGRLPGLSARAFVTQKAPSREVFREIELRCDTVILLPSAGMGVVVFHGVLAVRDDDAADIVHLVAACEEPSQPRPMEHYQRALALRLDKDKGALRDMSDSDLMPARESGVAGNIAIADFDVGRWTRSENLALHRGRKGHAREIERARARIEAEGLDPKEYGVHELPAMPEEPPLDDLDALAEYMEKHSAAIDQQKGELEKKAEEAKEQARKAFAEMGKDYDAEMAKAEKEGGGPPKFSAVEQLTRMSAMVADAAAEGVALPEMERQLDDPRYFQELISQEEGLREMYRRFGHLQPGAPLLDEESSGRIRTLIEIARENDESLAKRDFTGANLSGADLSGVDLTGAFLENANLRGAKLAGACLVNAVLARADLREADLTGAQLTGANLGGALLQGACLVDAEMSECVLARASLDRARFERARLDGADWLEVKPGAVDLSGTTLRQGTFLKADFSGARLTGADLSDATFIECQLDEADFSGATLEKATFVTCRGANVSFREARMKQAVMVHGSVFPEADFSGAEMEKANLRGAVLSGARFDGAELSGADLSECEVTGGSFERARMRGGMFVRTGLVEASLRGADMMDAIASKTRIAGADFTGANLYRADLSRAVRDGRTSFAEAKVERVRTLPKADVADKEMA